MSCFIVKDKINKAVTKICWLYGLRQEEQGSLPLSLEQLNFLLKKVTYVNCENYALRYKEDVEVYFSEFSEYPSFKIVPQDLMDCHCWLYQSCDYCDTDKTFILVKEALTYFEKIFGWNMKYYNNENCSWG